MPKGPSDDEKQFLPYVFSTAGAAYVLEKNARVIYMTKIELQKLMGAAYYWPDASNLAEQLIRTANDALYEAKSLGRNRAFFYQQQNAGATTASLAAVAL